MSTENGENGEDIRTRSYAERHEKDLRNGFSTLLSVGRRCNDPVRVLDKKFTKNNYVSVNRCDKYFQNHELKSKDCKNVSKPDVNDVTSNTEDKITSGSDRNSVMTKARRKILQKLMVAKMRNTLGCPIIYEVLNEEGIYKYKVFLNNLLPFQIMLIYLILTALNIFKCPIDY